MKTNLIAMTAILTVLTVVPAMATEAPAVTTTPHAATTTNTTAATTVRVQSQDPANLLRVRDLLAERGSATQGMITIDNALTAEGLIGKPVHNMRNEEIAKVEDILVDSSGKATYMILANDGIMGIGAKLVMVDFGTVYVRNSNGDAMVPISEETIKRMMPFSYDKADAASGTQTLPTGQLSAKAMLSGDLIDANNKEVASVDNLTISEGSIKQVIVSYNTTLGMGGDKVAVPFDQLQRVKNGESEVNFKLSSQLSSRFDTLRSAN